MDGQETPVCVPPQRCVSTNRIAGRHILRAISDKWFIQRYGEATKRNGRGQARCDRQRWRLDFGNENARITEGPSWLYCSPMSLVKPVISDYLAWYDVPEHCRLLQVKINT